MRNWVGDDINRVFELTVIESSRVDGFANWKTSLELLDKADKSNDTTDQVF